MAKRNKAVRTLRGVREDGVELRIRPAEIRATTGENGERYIEGVAIVYETPAEIWDFEETIARGAAADAIKAGGTVCLWNHNDDKPMARQSNGTLELEDREDGVAFRALLNETSYSIDGYIAIERGDVDGCSFAFIVDPDDGEEWTAEPGEPLRRRILHFSEIPDVSPVTYPAYEETTISARAEEIRTQYSARSDEPGEPSPEELPTGGGNGAESLEVDYLALELTEKS